MEYVCGFLFDHSREYFVSVLKNRPTWQKGLINGVGGAIEPFESALHAMRREMKEETGIVFSDWKEFVTLRGHETTPYMVHFFKGFADKSVLNMACSCTDERVQLLRTDLDRYEDLVPNLRWLIPLALSSEFEPIIVRDKEPSQNKN